jgi:choline dehydrogenase-like flavoprotein
VHLLAPELINDNNRLFVEGCRRAGFHAEQFPLNVKGCQGSSLCNLGCPNRAKQGTNRVQLPNAERLGVEVVTRATVHYLEERAVIVEVTEQMPGTKGRPSEWAPGVYRIRSSLVVLAGGSVGTSALILRSPALRGLKHIGESFTCHPAHILVAEHDREITNDVGHPKSFYVDRAEEEGYVLETCMYFPFTTAKNLTGFGASHSRFMQAFPRLQMILVLACDKAAWGNRITVDARGKPVVHYTCTKHTIGALVAATRASARIFFGAGARAVHVPWADAPVIEREDADRIDQLIRPQHFSAGRVGISAAHLMGGCRMGYPGEGVTDGWGRMYGVPWLRVADGSLFPNSLEINPYVTIMALADRVAESIKREAGVLRDAARAALSPALGSPAIRS